MLCLPAAHGFPARCWVSTLTLRHYISCTEQTGLARWLVLTTPPSRLRSSSVGPNSAIIPFNWIADLRAPMYRRQVMPIQTNAQQIAAAINIMR